ncbi:MAG: glycosyltransferase family 4 protein [Candidatus Dadabacteria bacterium]|nr:glycosyltransferase family 4 protein [Candidatus Dadabacteria bacterium]
MTTVYMFNQYASYPGVPGSTRHYNLARELVRQGIGVYIFSSNFSHMLKSRIRDVDGPYMIETVDGVNYVRMNTFGYFHNDWRRVLNMADYARKSYAIARGLSRKGIVPDVVMGTVAHPFSVGSAYVTAKRLGARFFIDIGDLWPEVFAAAGKMTERHPLYITVGKTMTWFYGKAEKIICLTDEAEKYFKSRGYGDKTILLPPGIRLDGALPSVPAPVSGGPFRVVYAGSFQPIYPLDTVIEAARILKDRGRGDIRLTLVGGGVRADSLKSLAGGIGADNVEFMPPMPKGELLEFLKTASAFVLIEKKASYGFPNKIIDYLSSGAPIIYASPVRHAILESGSCVEAPHDDPEGMADAIGRVASMSREERNEMAACGARFLKKNHDIERLAGRLVEHIRRPARADAIQTPAALRREAPK